MMQIKKMIDHESSICYVVSNVEGMTFDDIILFAEQTHGKSWSITGCNVNHLNQPWIMLTDPIVEVKPGHELKYLFFFLESVDEAPNSAFEQCIENWEIQNARISGTPRGNIAKLPWTY